MPYKVTGAGLKEVNGVYYRTNLFPPKFIMTKNDATNREYALYLDHKYDKWYIARADLAIYIPIYYALNPRIERLKDTFFDKDYHLPEEFRKYETEIKRAKNKLRGKILPSLSCWRPFLQNQKHLEKIAKGIFPPPNVVPLDDAKSIQTLHKNNIFWFSTMLRISDIKKSTSFYINTFQLKVFYMEQRISNDLHNDDQVQSIYLCTPKLNRQYDDNFTSNTARDQLFTYNGGVLELVYHVKDDVIIKRKYLSGNERGTRGFGHIGFNTQDMPAVYDEMKTKIDFIKAPGEGTGKIDRQCFIADPDGYHVEIISRDPKKKKVFKRNWLGGVKDFPKFNFSQTMLRIKDAEMSLKFYCDVLNMKLMREMHFPQFRISVFYLQSESHSHPNPHCQNDYDTMHYVLTRFDPFLELVQSHPANKDHSYPEEFKWHNGNKPNEKGFGNLGFLVDDLDAVIDALEQLKFMRVNVIVHPKNAKNKSTAFITDPDGYHIKLLQRSIVPRYIENDGDDEKTQ